MGIYQPRNTPKTIMTHTKAYLSLELNRKQVYEIARGIATEKGITGISKFTKDKLIMFILENQTVESTTEPTSEATTEPTTETTELQVLEDVPTPQEFFDKVSKLDNKLEVHKVCNALNAALTEKYATPATVSWKQSEYKKPFYNFQHSNPKLNETVTVKGEIKNQHIAANLITLSDEQKTELATTREEKELSRLGIDSDGDIRDIELPPQEIKTIVEKSCKLITSPYAVDIACGLLPLTGLRRNEQNMPAIEYESGVIVREWKVIGEFLIAIKGLSKKGGFDGWYSRVTLAPAQMIVDAQKRFLASPKIQSISSNYNEFNNSGFRKAVDRRFKEIWDKEFSTIEAYDDNGNKIDNNASTHKARAFYTWALVPVLKKHGFNQKQAKLYLKNCLGHDNIKDTDKYFNRYDENQFVDAIDINIPTNFKEIGLIDVAIVEKLNSEIESSKPQIVSKEVETETETKTETETTNQTFDLQRFVDEIPEELQIKFTKLLNDGVDLTSALVKTVKDATITKVEKEEKPLVSDKITEILTAVMEYNEQQPEVKNIVVPSYAAVNRIHKFWQGKEIARKTYDEVWKEYGRDIVERLQNRDIPNISRDEAKSQGLVSQEMHNGKYHRRDMDDVASKVVNILNS